MRFVQGTAKHLYILFFGICWREQTIHLYVHKTEPDLALLFYNSIARPSSQASTASIFYVDHQYSLPWYLAPFLQRLPTQYPPTHT